MKKILNLFGQTFLVTGFSLVPVACYDSLSNSGGEEGKPPEPPVKDSAYYQELINEKQDEIDELTLFIAEIKDARDDYDNEKEYQSSLDELVAEQYTYRSLINEYQYQILLLEKQNDKFTVEQLIKGISIISNKIINLRKELELKKNLYPDPAPDEELVVIQDSIRAANELLAMLIKLKEEEEQ